MPEHDDVYEVIKTNDTEYIDNEDDGVVIEHDTGSVKTSVKNENKSLTTSMEKISGDIQSEHSETNITWLESDQQTKEILDRKQCEQFWQQFPRSWNKREEDIFFKWPSVWTDSCGTHRKSTDALKQTQSQNWQFTKKEKKSRKMKINAELELEFSMKEDIASILTNKVVVVTGLYYGYGYIIIIIIIIIYTNYFEDLHHAKDISTLCDVIFQVNKYILFMSQTGPSQPCVTNGE